MQSSEWDVEYAYALAQGQQDQEARMTANKVCIMMGSPIPQQATPSPRPPLPRTECVMCGVPYPAHLTGAVVHEMVWPEEDI